MKKFEFETISKKRYALFLLLNVLVSVIIWCIAIWLTASGLSLLVFPISLLAFYFLARNMYRRFTCIVEEEYGMRIEWRKHNSRKKVATTVIHWSNIKDYRYEQTSYYDQFRIRYKNGGETRIHFSGFYRDNRLVEFIDWFEQRAKSINQKNDDLLLKRLKSQHETWIGKKAPLIMALLFLLSAFGLYFKQATDRIGVIVFLILGIAGLLVTLYPYLKKRGPK